jgi:hypothetical protein
MVIKTFRDFMRVEEEGMRNLLNELSTGNNLIFKSSFLELLNLTLGVAGEAEKISLIGAYHKSGISFQFFQVKSSSRVSLRKFYLTKRVRLIFIFHPFPGSDFSPGPPKRFSG